MKYGSLLNTLIPDFKAFLTLCFITMAVFLQHGNAQNLQSDSTDYKGSNIVLPAISSSPETSLLLGGVLIRQFKLGTSYENTRTSTALISAIYTLNNQMSIGIFPALFLPDENWVLEGGYAFNYFPESFWGIGRQAQDEDETTVNSRQVLLQQSILKKIYPNMFIGPQFRWINTYDISFEDPDGEILPLPEINGVRGYQSFGAGAIFRWDDRNMSTTPTSGKFIQFSFMANPSWLGTGDSYTSYLIDSRKYVDLSDRGRSVWAFHSLMQFRTGTPPFKDMASMGGESIMRGYYAGRYRDKNGTQLQTEFRQHLLGRLGFTVFAATGQVWSSFDEMNLDQTLWSAGGGLRFNLSKQEPMNIRADLAFGQNTSGFYITLGEAF